MMRHTRLFRLMAAFFGVWFIVTLVQPNGMMGMTMSGSSATMDMSSMSVGMTMSGSDMSADHLATMHSAVHTEMASQQVIDQGAPAQSKTSPECDQHDCCCSALSPISHLPVATLAWLPEHIVNQETPESGNGVVHTDGQLLLPFANGPPRTVRA